ncbi:4-hydroxybenzoate octaprenyltransferase [Pseudomonadota bacterium]
MNEIGERLQLYARLMRIDRPIGTLLLLWPTLWALWVAGQGHPGPDIICIFLAGVFVMRAAGCVVNDYADRNLDPFVERTRQRPLATGQVSSKEALILFVVLCLSALALVLMLNRLTIFLSLVGIILAITYPFFKRFTHLPQLYLGLAFSWGIPMAFAAQSNAVPAVAWWLLLANFLWVVAYDTLYAMVDREDDLRVGIKSIAILAGDFDRWLVAVGHLGMLLTLVVVGLQLELNVYFFTALVLALGMVFYQLVISWERDRQRCFEAFLSNAWMGTVIFLGILLAYL